jgi:hypothetical protein
MTKSAKFFSANASASADATACGDNIEIIEIAEPVDTLMAEKPATNMA